MSDSNVTTEVHKFVGFQHDNQPRRKMSNIIAHVIQADELTAYDRYELICRVTNPLAFAALSAAQWQVIGEQRATANDEQDKLMSTSGLGSDAFGEFLKTSHTEEIGFVAPERNGPEVIELYLTTYKLAGRLMSAMEQNSMFKPKDGDKTGIMQPYPLKAAFDFRTGQEPTGQPVSKLHNELNQLLMAEEEAAGLPAMEIEKDVAERRQKQQELNRENFKKAWPDIQAKAFSYSLLNGMTALEEAWNQMPLITQFKCWASVMAGVHKAVGRARLRATQLANKDIGDKAQQYHSVLTELYSGLLAEWVSDYAKFREELVSAQENNLLRSEIIPDHLVKLADKVLTHPTVGSDLLKEWAAEHSTE